MEGNTRAVSIFTTYMLTNISLCILVVRDIYITLNSTTLATRHPSYSRSKIQIHAILALICLGVTWYYMISFFSLSYRSWAYQKHVELPQSFHNVLLDPSSIRLGLWLKDVQLFRDAWEIVVETPNRLCWSQPIFFITAGWSFYIAMKAHSKNIAHAWAYMVIGQLVAISFAMNLFFIAVASYQIAESSSRRTKITEGTEKVVKQRSSGQKILWTPPFVLYLAITIATVASVVAVPSAAGSTRFLQVLSISHVVLLLPPVICKTVPRFMRIDHSAKSYKNQHLMQMALILVSFVLLQIYALWRAYQHVDPKGYLHRHSNVYVRPVWVTKHLIPSQLHSLWDHPAVSSVGWDSILCITSILIAGCYAW